MTFLERSLNSYQQTGNNSWKLSNLQCELIMFWMIRESVEVNVLKRDSLYVYVNGMFLVERSGSGVELRTLDYENPGSNPGCVVKTLGKFFHST